MSDVDRLRPLRRAEYDRLVEQGCFEDEKIELLRGMLVEMSPQGSPHAGLTARIGNLFKNRLGASIDIRMHSPFAATADSEPEPDLQITEPGILTAHPDAAYLIVEVSNTSQRMDRGIKAAIYAEAGVPEYWVVDVPKQTIDVYTAPVDGEYAQKRRAARGDTIRPVSFPALELAVDDLLGPQSSI